MKEVDIQTKIKKSIIIDGGFAFKLSNAYSSGVPDLFCALPPFVPCLIEVKNLGETVNNFNLQVGITALQQNTLKKASGVYGETYGAVSCILVALFHNGEHRLVVLPKNAERLTASYQADPGCWRKRVSRSGVEGGYYEVRPLLEHVDIRRFW